MRTLILLLSLLALAGCSILPHRNASWNKKIEPTPPPTKASFDVAKRGVFDDTLFVIASSGGGSRAAVFTANVFLKLQDTPVSRNGVDSNLLAEVDAISSVSGGSMTTAFYAIAPAHGETCKAGESNDARQLWDAENVRDKMGTNFELQWFGRWFLPQNIIRFWFTSYDRSDIMSQVFANTLYDRRYELGTYTFADICDDRPNIILNATNGTLPAPGDLGDANCAGDSGGKGFGSLFTFTDCEFRKLGSSINKYHIADAVMSSSAFPAAFNYTTLRDFAQQERLQVSNAYLHLFDGGSHDNLGLESVRHLVERNSEKFRRIVVLLVDAYTRPQGVPVDSPEARRGFDYIVDTNFLDSVDALMTKNRASLIRRFKEDLEKLESRENIEETFFYHLTFDTVKDEELRSRLHRIKTRFKIRKDQAADLQSAVEDLMAPSDPCFTGLQRMVAGGRAPAGNCVVLKQDESE